MRTGTLTREQIVEAAVGLLDRDGLEGLNMRALGRRLGSAATAVYWHVGSKDDLVALAGDRVWHEISLPDPGTTGWRAAARSMATDLHAMLARHPWLVQAFGSIVLYGRGKARYDDHSLAVYEHAGFTGARAERAAASVFTFVLGDALGRAAVAALTRKLDRAGPTAKAAARESMARARGIAVQFPRLRARLAVDTAAAGYGAAPEKTFEFGLEAMLDGLEAQLSSARAALARPAGKPRGRARERRAPARPESQRSPSSEP